MKKILAVTFLTFAGTALATSKIEVQGSCDIKVTPDRGVITFTAEHQEKNQKDAVKKSHDQINKLKEEIKALNLSDLELKTTNYSVHQVRDYEKERYVDKGYRATLSLEVTTSNIAELGNATVKASNVGIKNVGSLSTFLSTEKTQAEYLKCLDIAAMDAKKKALQLANKLGFKVGDVINVTETPSIERPYPERPILKMAMASMDSAPSDVEAGKMQFSTTIKVTFKIK